MEPFLHRHLQGLIGELERDRRRIADRRQEQTSPLSRYLFKGRRRFIRRKADRRIHPYVDRYGPLLFLSILLIVVLSVLDAYFTIFHVDKGAREVNPLMSYLIGRGSLYFFAFKYTLTALGLFLLCIYKNLLIAKVLVVAVFLMYLVVFAHHIFLVLQR
ncbi:MAG: hypothetical protein JRJ26_18725 [Deltaproteobacteria bacterium]|nr:hypothetical protein [Deltaproteobacteria bacterium]